MAKYLIHACPDRMWYVNKYLIPSMINQGINNDDIMVYNDTRHLGNLEAYVESCRELELLADPQEIVWHLQDDVAISSVFKQYTEVQYQSDIVCGFCTKEQLPSKIGQVDPKDMWYSFQCIGIKNYIASGCANWFIDGKGIYTPELSSLVAKMLGDDEVFKYYCTKICSGLKALNLIPNLVEHIDFMIGGSTAAKGMPQRRAMYLKDGTEVVQDLEKKLGVQK